MIPLSEENKEEREEKKPRLLKTRGVLLFFLLVLFAEFLFLSDYTGRISLEELLASIAPEKLVELTNVRRQEAEIDTLTADPTLEKAAELKAQDMAKKGYFAHTSPEGIDPWHWFNEVGYDYIYAGENLAVNFREAHQVDEAWMQSPTHRDNIINERFEEIGIATAEGEYKENEAIFVVQLFGTRREGRPSFTSEAEEGLTLLNEDDPEGEQAPVEAGEEEDVEKEQEEKEEEEEQDKKSFAFMEKEDEENVLSIGPPEEVIIKEYSEVEEEEYTSFWGRIVSSPGKFFPYLFFVFGSVFLVSVLIKILFIKRLHLPLVLANELIIVFILLSAFLTKHVVLQLVGLV